jgi:hypothetical protein
LIEIIKTGWLIKIETNNNTLLHSVPYHPETNAIEEFLVNYTSEDLKPHTVGVLVSNL